MYFVCHVDACVCSFVCNPFFSSQHLFVVCVCLSALCYFLVVVYDILVDVMFIVVLFYAFCMICLSMLICFVVFPFSRAKTAAAAAEAALRPELASR